MQERNVEKPLLERVRGERNRKRSRIEREEKRKKEIGRKQD